MNADTLLTLTNAESVRFWKKVSKSDGCWNWIGGRTTAGYGMFLLRRKLIYAHRLSFAIAHGEIGAGICVLHRCDNPACINPEHLFEGSKRDNVRDMLEKGREARGSGLPQAKLTESLVADIRERHASGAVQRRIAAACGVSHSVVSEAIARKTWRHVA